MPTKKKTAKKTKPNPVYEDLYEHIGIIAGYCEEVLKMLEADAKGDTSQPNDPDSAIQAIYDNVDEMQEYWPRFTN